MFTVRGIHRNAPYAVQVDGGTIVGSGLVRDTLLDNVGRPHKGSPTGEAHDLAMTDETSVLAALYDLTTVTGVTGDAPDLGNAEPDPKDAVY